MNVVGVFRELTRNRSGTNLPSIYASKDALSRKDAGIIAAYLRCGVPVFDVMEATQDPFDSEVFVSGGPSLRSDGTWVWREDLIHYIERYRVDLPTEFIAHVRNMAGIRHDEKSITARWREILAAYERAEAGLQ
jgi:hypothetical protein